MPLHRQRETWRDRYNPLRGLTLARIVAMEDAADQGQPADLQWLWHHMELVNETVPAAIARRNAFLDNLEPPSPAATASQAGRSAPPTTPTPCSPSTAPPIAPRAGSALDRRA